MQFFFAPVQGHTDAAYRHFHSKLYPDNITYFTPFIRLEKNDLRPKDLKDWKSTLNEGINLVPQIIFRNQEELSRLVELLIQEGAAEINLNMGCPFPLQTGHGRGAATIANEKLAVYVNDVITSNPDILFSVKMRLGMTAKDEWHILLDALNDTTLSHITLHPRIAKQQYGGVPDLEEFGKFIEESKNPVIYNGDIKTPDDMVRIKKMFPGIDGMMIGRGLLNRPSLVKEYNAGKEWNYKDRIINLLSFHNDLWKYYSDNLCGEAQIISKIQPFWEYSEQEIGRKAWKAIKKATNMAKYQTAVAIVQNSII